MKKPLHFVLPKILKFSLILFFASIVNGFGQTTLTTGDAAIVGFNSANPDKISIVLLKDIVTNTVINLTDNGFTAGTTGRTGEGFLIYTAPTNQPAGTVLTWTNGQVITGTGWSSAAPSNFALNGSGDQLFIFQGNTANWAAQTGITLLFGGNFGTALSATSAAANTVQPTALTGSNFLNLPNTSHANCYFANGSTSTSAVTLTNTAANLLALFGDATKWFGNSAVAATFPTYSITVGGTPTITTTGMLSAVNTTYGMPSASPTSFTVSGSNLTNNILVTPPSGYEVSQTVGGASGYTDTQTLTQSGGNVSSTTIFVRLKATASVAGSPYSGDIIISSSGATSLNVATVSSSVTTKAVTITGITANNKVYDGNTTATFSGTATYNGLENGETFSVTGSPTATFTNASVGNSKTVNVVGYTAPSNNYTLLQPTLSANITAAPLTISSPIAQNKVYDGHTNAIITGTLAGIIGSETVTLNGTGTFTQTNIGTGIAITSTATLSGANAENYSLTQPIGLMADITTKSLTISGLSANNKTFDGNITATLSGTSALNGLVVGDEANVVLGGTPVATFAQSAVGTGIAVTVTGYSISGSLAGNYELSQPSGLTADITNTPTPVINSLLTASAIYGELAPAYTITATNSPTSFNATGLPDGLAINTTTGEISGTPTNVADSPFSITISATNAGGTGNATLVYTINKKTLTVNAATANNKVYERTDAAIITGTLNGVVGVDVVSLNGTGTFAQVNVGDGIVVTSTATLGGADAIKYILTQPTGLSANITKKDLTVSGASAANKVYDANTSAVISGAILVGVINPDNVTVSGNGTFASADVADNIVITTSLVLGGADAANYSITQPSGIVANITKATLTITGITADNKIYDGNTNATINGTASLNGVLNGDDVTISGTVVAMFNNKNIGNAKPITVTGYTLSGTKAGNYSVSQPTGLTANISALALTISGATAQNKVFDGNTNATITGTLTGVISPDVVTFVGAGTFASSAVGNGIAVTANITLGGVGASNYTITQPTGLTANITPPPSLTEIIFPQFIQGVNGTNTNRIPFAYRATLNNLLPNATYRYYNGVELTTASLTSVGAGNNIFPDINASNNFVYSTAPSLATVGGYGSFATDATGSYSGWFVIAPSGNATRFVPGTNLYTRIILNNGAGGTTSATVLSSTNTIKVINLVNAAGTNNGTALRGNSGATDKNFVFAYDNTIGTGRPLSGTFVENDGAAEVTSFATFYTSSVDGVSGAYGMIIPNTNANGVKRIEQRDFATGTVTGCAATDDDGVWASGANTVNPTGGTSAIVFTSSDAPLNSCQVFNTAPTIAINVATTSDYIDGGTNTNISSAYSLSGVINDPTDPAQTVGIDFIIGDAETVVGSLIVTVSSSNTTVVPNANLNLTGSGASRTLKITPATVGYASITVTVNDGTTTSTFTINYAASQASINPLTTHFHAGKSDASTAIAIDSDFMLVGDDEDQTIRLYNRHNSGLPVNSFNFTSVLGLTDLSGGVPREVDIESSMKVGNSIYWMGSESNASSGNSRPNRNRVFKTDITGTDAATTLTYASRYDFLKDDILAWDANNTHGKGANYYGLVASAATGIIPESAGLNGFNIEGIEMAPDNTTAYIAFRAPQVIPSDRKKALIMPVTNFTSILTAGGGTIGSATFGTPIEINLGERGIREIRKNAANEYIIIAGPADGSTGISPKDFKLFTWTGNPADEPIKRGVNLLSLNVEGSFESIVEVPANLSENSNLQLLVDNGDAIYYNDGVIAKDLLQANHKKFRSENITLAAPSLAIGTISGNSFCQSAAINVPLIINNETFNVGNIFTAQLSDANGSFANPNLIGSLTDINAGTIAATIPANAIAGTNYRIRVVSSYPSIIGGDNGSNLAINIIPAKPTISANSSTICNGNTVTLTASACVGGTLNWTGGLTGTSITVSPSTTTSYSVTCTISSCTSVLSDATIITVNPVPAKPTISANSSTICNGNTVTLTASACVGGTLNWTGGLTGTSITVSPSTTTSYSVTCTISSCTSVLSDATIITVNAKPNAPTLAANPSSITIGQSSTLTATGCDGGTITWSLNNSTVNPLIVSPSSNTNYTATCSQNGCVSNISQIVTVTVTATGPCQNQVTLASSSDDYVSGTQLKQANASTGNIQASNKISGNAVVTYQAKSIQLLAGFKADSGTVFKAEIGGCN